MHIWIFSTYLGEHHEHADYASTATEDPTAFYPLDDSDNEIRRVIKVFWPELPAAVVAEMRLIRLPSGVLVATDKEFRQTSLPARGKQRFRNVMEFGDLGYT